MFTGIIQARGRVAARVPSGDGLRLRIDAGKLDLSEVAIGDSIATSGVCLTAVAIDDGCYEADVSRESLSLTSLGGLAVGDPVNLELAMTPSSRLGGHLVSGHVDGLGTVVERRPDGNAIRFRIRAPDELARYIAHKGSITVDGISLTVNAVDGATFDLTIVPHTLAETTMEGFRPGRKVNLEVDLVARYLERLLLGERAAQPGATGISEAWLAEQGFPRRGR